MPSLLVFFLLIDFYFFLLEEECGCGMEDGLLGEEL